MTTAAALTDLALSLAEREREILTPEAVMFLRELHKRFEGVRTGLLERRRERQQYFDSGGFPRFLPETQHIRDADWTVAPIPDELLDRRVEITGPTERKMVIN